MLNYKITHWVIKEQFAIQLEDESIIDEERKDWQHSIKRLLNGCLNKSWIFNLKREHLSIKKDKIDSVQLQGNQMGDYKRVC